jgi:hypothetical protein
MGYPNLAETPPSTTIVWPVIYDERPPHKNKIAEAMSAGNAVRRNGAFATLRALPASSR